MNGLQPVTEDNFNEVAYILANPDVGLAIVNGKIRSAWDHFASFGHKENRKQIASSVSQKKLDAAYLAHDVPFSGIARHANQGALIKSLLKPGMKVLEVGSRCVTSESMWLRQAAEEANATYVGFDYYDGNNVDVVGDAHLLSTYFKDRFDLVYSSAVFEHLAMPWVVAVEISKCMKVGGELYVETHFSWKSHERPWHFFQFSDMALRALFSPALGFECVDAGVSNPLVGRFSSLADEYLRYKPVPAIYCHSEFYGRKRQGRTGVFVGERKYF